MVFVSYLEGTIIIAKMSTVEPRLSRFENDPCGEN